MKNTTTKWLVRLDDMGQVMIIPKEVNRHAPINRILDNVGFYDLDSITVGGKKYLIVMKPEERYSIKSLVLVSKINQDEKGEGFIDMERDDSLNMEVVADKYLKDSNIMKQ